MECPTPCYLCGSIYPLDQLAFFTDYCECQRYGLTGCTHGLCRECNSAWNEEDTDEEDDAI